jgi:N-acetylglucosaminyl-diphospho-decaprenol L-rhamnosyltransferase
MSGNYPDFGHGGGGVFDVKIAAGNKVPTFGRIKRDESALSRQTLSITEPVELKGANQTGDGSGLVSPTAGVFDLAILIVNWNGGEMLRDLLLSIDKNRGDLRLQTIVVDNASRDGSTAMLETDFPQVRLIRNFENLGFGRANNQAAKEADAPILLMLNNDTVMLPGAMQKLMDFLGRHSEVVAVGPKMLDGNGRPQTSGRNLPSLPAVLHSLHVTKWMGMSRRAYKQYRKTEHDPGCEGPVPQVDAACLAIRRSVFEECGGFDEGYEFGVEDVDLCVRLAKLGTIYYLPEAEVQHYGRVSSRANRFLANRGYFCGWARYLRKHHGRGSAWFYKLATTLDMPVRMSILSVRWLSHWERGKRTELRRTSANLRSLAWFTLTSLPRLWWS